MPVERYETGIYCVHISCERSIQFAYEEKGFIVDGGGSGSARNRGEFFVGQMSFRARRELIDGRI